MPYWPRAGAKLDDKQEPRASYTAGMAIRKTGKVVGRRAKPDHSPPEELWREMNVLFRSIPETERARMPRDAAKNFDHYVDGTTRQD